MGSIWGRQDPGGPHVGPMNLAIWVLTILKLALYKIIVSPRVTGGLLVSGPVPPPPPLPDAMLETHVTLNFDINYDLTMNPLLFKVKEFE